MTRSGIWERRGLSAGENREGALPEPYALVIKVLEFLAEPEVFEQNRPSITCFETALIVNANSIVCCHPMDVRDGFLLGGRLLDGRILAGRRLHLRTVFVTGKGTAGSDKRRARQGSKEG